MESTLCAALRHPVVMSPSVVLFAVPPAVVNTVAGLFNATLVRQLVFAFNPYTHNIFLLEARYTFPRAMVGQENLLNTVITSVEFISEFHNSFVISLALMACSIP